MVLSVRVDTLAIEAACVVRAVALAEGGAWRCCACARVRVGPALAVVDGLGVSLGGNGLLLATRFASPPC